MNCKLYNSITKVAKNSSQSHNGLFTKLIQTTFNSNKTDNFFKMQIAFTGLLFIVLSSLQMVKATDEKTIWLGDLLNIKLFETAINPPRNNTCFSGNPMKIAGKLFDKGLGARSVSALYFELEGKASMFSAMVGQDDASRLNLIVQFYVIGDQKILFESTPMRIGDAAQKIDVELKGVHKLALLMTDNISDLGIAAAYGDWANAKIITEATELTTVKLPNNKYILTPQASSQPKINGAKIFGATPGNPFLFTVNATGERPMKFSADHLPPGLSIDSKTGIITGKVIKPGKYQVIVKAENRLGKTSRELRIHIGDAICLTPPIGWNGWNSWQREITQDKVSKSAKAMYERGLVNHGWTYINVDDCWEGLRGGKYMGLQANERFPDFKGMMDTIHAMGMKAGLYSTPWITTYAGYNGGSSDNEKGEFTAEMRAVKNTYRRIGKYRFEENDAKQWADWGIDYLKYDWRIDIKSTELMSKALKNSGRDIVYSISNSAPFSNVSDWQKLTTLWRTGGDIRDTWFSLFNCGFRIDKWGPYGGPGHWNDPDMLIIGEMSTGSDPHPTRLTPDEQYTHVSLWSLLAAPLLIGCPMDKADDFTMNLLTNDEVIDIDQDPLGKPGRQIINENSHQVWAKQMEDGSLAVGIFNTAGFISTPESFFAWGTESPKEISIDFSKLGLKGKYKLRDVWRQKDLGVFENNFKEIVPYHGVLLLRMFPR